MNRKPHSLNITCSYQLSNRKTKKKIFKSEVTGWINVKDGKNVLRLPMRSFVQGFLNKLWAIFAGETTSNYHIVTNVSAASVGASAARRSGILLGTGMTPVALTQTALVSQVVDSTICDMKVTTTTPPYSLDSNTLATKVSRLFTNASSSAWNVYEAGIKGRNVTATAASTSGMLFTRDVFKSPLIFNAVSDKLIEIEFRATTSTEKGGAVLNFMRLIHNLYLKGSTNSSTFLPRSGTVTASYGVTTASLNPFVVDGIASKLWGIVVGKTSDDSNFPISPDEYKFNFGSEFTDLTYGANIVSAVTISGTKAYFTISRDITNSTGATKYINRIGLLGKGATANPSTLQNDQIYFMINREGDENNYEGIALQNNQTIRVEYTFEIQV